MHSVADPRNGRDLTSARSYFAGDILHSKLRRPKQLSGEALHRAPTISSGGPAIPLAAPRLPARIYARNGQDTT
jgi:hypothetical protein